MYESTKQTATRLSLNIYHAININPKPLNVKCSVNSLVPVGVRHRGRSSDRDEAYGPKFLCICNSKCFFFFSRTVYYRTYKPVQRQRRHTSFKCCYGWAHSPGDHGCSRRKKFFWLYTGKKRETFICTAAKCIKGKLSNPNIYTRAWYVFSRFVRPIRLHNALGIVFHLISESHLDFFRTNVGHLRPARCGAECKSS